jgi:hypothetical protein
MARCGLGGFTEVGQVIEQRCRPIGGLGQDVDGAPLLGRIDRRLGIRRRQRAHAVQERLDAPHHLAGIVVVELDLVLDGFAGPLRDREHALANAEAHHLQQDLRVVIGNEFFSRAPRREKFCLHRHAVGDSHAIELDADIANGWMVDDLAAPRDGVCTL